MTAGENYQAEKINSKRSHQKNTGDRPYIQQFRQKLPSPAFTTTKYLQSTYLLKGKYLDLLTSERETDRQTETERHRDRQTDRERAS